MAKKTEAEDQEVSIEARMLLAEIANATEHSGMFYIFAERHPELLTRKFIEVNTSIKNDEGDIAARITAKGREWLAAQQAAITPGAVVEAFASLASDVVHIVESLPASDLKSKYALVSNVPVPEAAPRGGGHGRASKWPFEQMEIGQSFFIADGVQDGKPFKAATKYASTCSNANARFAVPVPGVARQQKKRDGTVVEVQKKEFTRRFVILAVTGDIWGHPGVTGAAIWRVK